MVNTYTILFKKNNIRVSAGRLSGADSRIFHTHLKNLVKSFENVHGEKLNNSSLLIVINGKEKYRRRTGLEFLEIKTIADIIEIEELENISHILADGILISDRNKLLESISVLELFTPEMYQSDELEKKNTKR